MIAWVVKFFKDKKITAKDIRSIRQRGVLWQGTSIL